MPTVTKQPVFKFEPITRLIGGKPETIGFRATGDLMFTDFPNEKDGREYQLPLKARGTDGKLARHLLIADTRGRITGVSEKYKNEPPIKNPAGKVMVAGKETDELYVREDGTLDANPYAGENRYSGWRKGFVLLAQQATPHQDFSATYTDPSIVWPDGQIRKMRITVKANDPMTTDDYVAKQQATQERRVNAAVGKVSGAHVDSILIGILCKKYVGVEDGRDKAEAMLGSMFPNPDTYMGILNEHFPPATDTLTTETEGVAQA